MIKQLLFVILSTTLASLSWSQSRTVVDSYYDQVLLCKVSIILHDRAQLGVGKNIFSVEAAKGNPERFSVFAIGGTAISKGVISGSYTFTFTPDCEVTKQQVFIMYQNNDGLKVKLKELDLDKICSNTSTKVVTTQVVTTNNVSTPDNKVYENADREPQFPGGDKAMSQWLTDNFYYPQSAIKSKTEGTVYIQFVVEKNGELTNVEVLRSPSTALSDEAYRLVDSMPNWVAGEKNGQKVRVVVTIPVKFKL